MKTIRKTLALILSIFALCMLFISCSDNNTDRPNNDFENPNSNADNSDSTQLKPSEGLEYKLNDDGNGYIVIGIGSCEDANLVIPGEYNGLPVTSIGPAAFKNSDFWAYGNIKSVVFSESVVSIQSILQSKYHKNCLGRCC